MIGDGGVANYMLNRHSNGVSHVDHFSVAFTFGIAAMIGIAAAFPISGNVDADSVCTRTDASISAQEPTSTQQ